MHVVPLGVRVPLEAAPARLGVTRLANPGDGAIELADPDGNEFCLTHG